ncbi:MAG: T9SS type A sorting domain-containing protein [Ferruginibacter sp.]|nr:T9SS type A sorting domain-containing protein [Ferruginibacter sp.]
MKKIATSVLYFCLLHSSVTFAQCTSNFLENPSFEALVQPLLGNNFPAPNNTFSGWNIPSATAGVAAGGFNIVKVNGSTYTGGPDNAHGTGSQYIDINNGGGFVQQNFTLACPSTVIFSGWFSRREPGGAGFTSYIEILNGASIVATSSVVSFTSNESEETWKQVTGSTSLSAGTYTFRFFMDDFTNIDNAFLCASPGCILPITISGFSAISEKCTNKLSWQTSSEINVSRFDVEHSNDGINFKTAGTIPAKNITTGSSYNFNYPASGNVKTFYRLKGIDVDGKMSFSNIINISSNCKAVSIKVFPNPVADVLQINIANGNPSKLVVYNADGKMVIGLTILNNGDNTVNMKYLSKGVYIVKVFGINDTKIFSVTKL